MYRITWTREDGTYQQADYKLRREAVEAIITILAGHVHYEPKLAFTIEKQC